jgi:predicted RNA-binding protein
MEDVVFAHDNGKEVILKDIIGEFKIFEGAKIIKVNVLTTQLIIES